MTFDPPLKGVRVLDFSQFLAGPYASLKLADMGAEVLKVERPGKGDLSRHLYVSDCLIDGESTIFHAINRGKGSIAIDLKAEADRQKVWQLVEQTDVIIQNFRPGVIERLGFGYDAVSQRKADIVYGSISGFGTGEWDSLPGQDLLAQARSGIMWLSGAADDGPVAIGLPIADILAGAQLTQGLLSLLFRRERTGKGGLVETSLLEALVDLQFEVLTTHLNDGGRLPQRPAANAAHAYLAAPYGVYRTADGYIAVAMNDLDRLAACLDMSRSIAAMDPFRHRDAITAELATRLADCDTAQWIQRMVAADIWAAPVMDWPALLDSGVLQKQGMFGDLTRGVERYRAIRGAVRIDGKRPALAAAAPRLGQDRGWIAPSPGNGVPSTEP